MQDLLGESRALHDQANNLHRFALVEGSMDRGKERRGFSKSKAIPVATLPDFATSKLLDRSASFAAASTLACCLSCTKHSCAARTWTQSL